MKKQPTISKLAVRECFQFLDELRKSGKVNMYGSTTYVSNHFGWDYGKSLHLVVHWMSTFDLEKSRNKRVQLALPKIREALEKMAVANMKDLLSGHRKVKLSELPWKGAHYGI